MAARPPKDSPASVPDPESEDERLDEGLEESFPASDPPSQVQPHPHEEDNASSQSVERPLRG